MSVGIITADARGQRNRLITCNDCRRTSANWHDVKEGFCGWCKAWHDTLQFECRSCGRTVRRPLDRLAGSRLREPFSEICVSCSSG